MTDANGKHSFIHSCIFIKLCQNAESTIFKSKLVCDCFTKNMYTLHLRSTETYSTVGWNPLLLSCHLQGAICRGEVILTPTDLSFVPCWYCHKDPTESIFSLSLSSLSALNCPGYEQYTTESYWKIIEHVLQVSRNFWLNVAFRSGTIFRKTPKSAPLYLSQFQMHAHKSDLGAILAIGGLTNFYETGGFVMLSAVNIPNFAILKPQILYSNLKSSNRCVCQQRHRLEGQRYSPERDCAWTDTITHGALHF